MKHLRKRGQKQSKHLRHFSIQASPRPPLKLYLMGLPKNRAVIETSDIRNEREEREEKEGGPSVKFHDGASRQEEEMGADRSLRGH